ncbi:MAG: hypothetical protein ACI9T8_000343 [Candidatus Saccharimonadales bacterium]|jgi:hypothetical protein
MSLQLPGIGKHETLPAQTGGIAEIFKFRITELLSSTLEIDRVVPLMIQEANSRKDLTTEWFSKHDFTARSKRQMSAIAESAVGSVNEAVQTMMDGNSMGLNRVSTPAERSHYVTDITSEPSNSNDFPTNPAIEEARAMVSAVHSQSEDTRNTAASPVTTPYTYPVEADPRSDDLTIAA